MPIEIRDDMSWSSYEDLDCPLCAEHFDYDEINFFPCSCGYQICKFCFHRLSTDNNESAQICPACRKKYDEKPALSMPINAKLAAKLDAAQLKCKPQTTKHVIEQKDPIELFEQRKSLTGIRVLQKNLVFIVGLTRETAKEEVLRRHFGRHGPIKKVAITYPNQDCTSYIQAYLTYQHGDDALRAIIAGNQSILDGRVLRCSLGTTKYCARYLRGQECTQTECMYLHEVASSDASFTKTQMNAQKHKEYEHDLLDRFQRAERSRLNESSGSWRNSQKITPPKPGNSASFAPVFKKPAQPLNNVSPSAWGKISNNTLRPQKPPTSRKIAPPKKKVESQQVCQVLWNQQQKYVSNCQRMNLKYNTMPTQNLNEEERKNAHWDSILRVLNGGERWPTKSISLFDNVQHCTYNTVYNRPKISEISSAQHRPFPEVPFNMNF